MSKEDSPEYTIRRTGVPHEEVVCPFSNGKWKRVGDALVFFMLFVVPVLFLISLILTSLY